jgi:hypothetical protein
MKVKEIIKTLKDSYHPDTNLIIDWADREQFNGDGETTEEVWNRAVELVEEKDVGSLDADYIQDFCYEAQEELYDINKN